MWKPGQTRLVSEHVTLGIEAFGYPYLRFEKTKDKDDFDERGFKRICVWDNGKLVTITFSQEVWKTNMHRTPYGCVQREGITQAKVLIDVKEADKPPGSKDIKNTCVKLVSIKYYELVDPHNE